MNLNLRSSMYYMNAHTKAFNKVLLNKNNTRGCYMYPTKCVSTFDAIAKFKPNNIWSIPDTMECFRYDYPITVQVKHGQTINAQYWSTGDCQKSFKAISCQQNTTTSSTSASKKPKPCTVDIDVNIQPQSRESLMNSTLTETMYYGQTSVW